MGLFSFSSFVTGAFLITACCCGASRTSMAYAAEQKPPTAVTERYYYVKGMTCSGCEFGVKKALGRAGIAKEQIIEVDSESPDPSNKIGHAKVKFPIGQHKGLETDCKVVKEIRANPGYIAYWDPSDTDPCKLDQKKS